MSDAVVPADPPAKERLMTADEVADLLQVKKSWVERQAREGTLPCVRIGRYVRYRPTEMHAFIARGGLGGLDV